MLVWSLGFAHWSFRPVGFPLSALRFLSTRHWDLNIGHFNLSAFRSARMGVAGIAVPAKPPTERPVSMLDSEPGQLAQRRSGRVIDF